MFMRAITHMLRSFLGKFVVAYFCDIFIFSRTQEKHLSHFIQVLDLWKKLFFSLQKYAFLSSCVHILGFIVSKDGVFIS